MIFEINIEKVDGASQEDWEKLEQELKDDAHNICASLEQWFQEWFEDGEADIAEVTAKGPIELP